MIDLSEQLVFGDDVSEYIKTLKINGFHKFVNEAIEIHGDVFDFSLIHEYPGYAEKVPIRCKRCNTEFEMQPRVVLRGTGCQFCKKNDRLKLTWDGNIKKAIKRHKGKYDYSLSSPVLISEQITIKCNDCGDVFKQKFHTHLKGIGCGRCAGNLPLTYEEFIRRCIDQYNGFYDYSPMNADDFKKLSGTKVKYICPLHGYKEQRAGDHMRGHKCPQCGTNHGLYNMRFFEKFPEKKMNVGYVYILKICIEDNDYIKIGISIDPENRFNGIKHQLNGAGTVEMLHCYKMNLHKAYQIENYMLDDSENFMVNINHEFRGKTEVRSIDYLDRALEVIENWVEYHDTPDGAPYD